MDARSHTKWLCVFLLLRASAHANDSLELDPVRDQLPLYRQRNKGMNMIFTTSNGVPVETRDTSSLNDTRIIYNNYFIELLVHLSEERTRPRVVHAKGAGAFGYFEVTNNVTGYIKADFLSEIGKKTPVAARFSPGNEERGGSDSTRGIHGFAVKFYTEEGNFDLLTLNTPIFGIKDPILFPAVTHVIKRNPVTNIRDSNMQWDFATLNPQSLNFFSQIFGDIGIPRGYRYMSGHAIHTFQFQNKYGKISFGRLHFIPDNGEASLTSEEGAKLDGSDRDAFTRDLYEAIACGKRVSWTLSIQFLTFEQAMDPAINAFDVTIELPFDDFPLTRVGRLVLDRNPVNYFADVEQIAFCPCNLVPGIVGAPDKLFEARLFVYRSDHIHRLGPNFNKINVNCPFKNKARTFNRDGEPPVGYNEGSGPNYYMNSFDLLRPYKDVYRSKLVEIVEKEPNNFGQVAQIYLDLSEGAKERLVSNIVSSLGPAIPFIQERAVKIYTKIEPSFGNRIRRGLSQYKREPACNVMFDQTT